MADVIDLAERLDLTAATPLSEDLKSHLDSSIVINAADVMYLGTPCLQVLAAARQEWATAGKSISYEDPSPEFSEHLELLGLKVADLECGEPAK